MVNLGEGLEIDLPKLIDTRALICANSGGGKSYAIRKLLEETHGLVQHIVLDLEGEFRSLREKFDYVLVGKDGDINLSIKGAELLARKILELNVSAIIDLYELKSQERKHFVKLFLDSLMSAPKDLWHPVIVIVDEAHILVPEKGESEAANSVIDLCCRGRKRGFSAILGSQRIAKVSKDAVAELNNVCIGRTGLDIDMKRASEILGFTVKSQMYDLRTLEAGEFFVFGPAISNVVKKVKIGIVKTKHIGSGAVSKELVINKQESKKIKEALVKLMDIPKDAEKELKDKQDLLNRINELKQELRVAKSSQKTDDLAVSKARMEESKEGLKNVKNLEILYNKSLRNYEIDFKKQLNESNAIIVRLKGCLKNVAELAARAAEIEIKIGTPKFVAPIVPEKKILFTERNNISKEENVVQEKKFLREEMKMDMNVEMDGLSDSFKVKSLDKCARRVYNFLYVNQGRTFTKAQIGCMTGYSFTSGGFSNALGALNSRGLISKKGNDIGIGESFDDSIIEDGEEFNIYCIKKHIDKCGNEILQVLLDDPDKEFSKEELSQSTKTAYSHTSGGFSNSIGRLNTLGLITKIDGKIKLNEEVYELM